MKKGLLFSLDFKFLFASRIKNMVLLSFYKISEIILTIIKKHIILYADIGNIECVIYGYKICRISFSLKLRKTCLT